MLKRFRSFGRVRLSNGLSGMVPIGSRAQSAAMSLAVSDAVQKNCGESAHPI